MELQVNTKSTLQFQLLSAVVPIYHLSATVRHLLRCAKGLFAPKSSFVSTISVARLPAFDLGQENSGLPYLTPQGANLSDLFGLGLAVFVYGALPCQALRHLGHVPCLGVIVSGAARQSRQVGRLAAKRPSRRFAAPPCRLISNSSLSQLLHSRLRSWCIAIASSNQCVRVYNRS